MGTKNRTKATMNMGTATAKKRKKNCEMLASSYFAVRQKVTRKRSRERLAYVDSKDLPTRTPVVRGWYYDVDALQLPLA